jgi:hypothetical protein
MITFRKIRFLAFGVLFGVLRVFTVSICEKSGIAESPQGDGLFKSHPPAGILESLNAFRISSRVDGLTLEVVVISPVRPPQSAVHARV